MSERPEWMPSREDVATAIRGVEYDFPTDQGWIRKYDVAPVESLISKACLRAQIAVLKKITAQFCHYCAHGLEVVSHPTAPGAFHVDDDGLFRDCESFEAITDEIAALRKELEG